MWFTYHQNNSGGSFVISDRVGHYVLIEAESARVADARAEDVGIYFDGCHKGLDCSCCGDRWYNANEGYSGPLIFGFPVQTFCPMGKEVIYLYHADGRKERITHTKEGMIHEPDCA